MPIKIDRTFFFRTVLLWALLLLQACTGVADHSNDKRDWIESKSWWVDKSGQAQLHEVMAVTDWQEFKNWKSFGFGSEAIWLRVKLKAAQEASPAPWVVSAGPVFLDHLTIFDPTANLVLRGGDSIAPTKEDLQSLNFSFQIPALAQERDLYVRVESMSSRPVFVDVQPFHDAIFALKMNDSLWAVVLVISTVLALWGAFQWWHTREKVIGVYAIKQSVTTVWLFSFSGYARLFLGPWLEPGVLTAIAVAVVPCLMASMLIFLSVLIQTYKPAKFWLYLSYALAVVFALMPLAQFFGLTRESLKLSNTLAPIALLLMVIKALSAVPSKVNNPIKIEYLVLYLLVYGFLTGLGPVTNLGLLQELPHILKSSLIHVILDSTVMFVMLQIRARALQREQLELSLKLETSTQRVQVEQRLREDQSKLFSMLAHEIKTPLATLGMWMETGTLNSNKLSRSISDMNLILERSVQAGQLADQSLQPATEQLDAAAITQACVQWCRTPDLVDWVCPQGAANLVGDGQMLQIVLSNLLDNACKYGQPPERVSLELEPCLQNERLGWRWRISNSVSPGEAPEANRLFEKYYRSTHARRQSGSGLGLFLVKGLMDLMQGTITYELKDTRVTFEVWLPSQAQWPRISA
jgi:signal transduction histidine kinase